MGKITEDILSRSYSAVTVSTTGTIRSPFRMDSAAWVCMGMTFSPERVTANIWKVLPCDEYHGDTMTYQERIATPVRGRGFYEGMKVKRGKEWYVLSCPRQIEVISHQEDEADCLRVAQTGSVPDLGSGGRRFKSSHGDHFSVTAEDVTQGGRPIFVDRFEYLGQHGRVQHSVPP